MRQSITSRHEILFRLLRRFIMKDLKDAGFQLRDIWDVIGGHPVFSGGARQNHGMHRDAVVNLLVRQAEIEFDRGRSSG